MSMARRPQDIKVYKIIVIGDSGVGKTCLTFRFCSGKFPGKTEVTIGVDFREKCVEIDGEIIKLQLWDTAGQERFRKSMIQHYYRNVNAVVFVYDVTNPSSFDSLPTWINECDKHHLNSCADVPRLIIGNKVDMGVQVVPTNTAQKFADLHNMPLFETSALDDSLANHVDSIFMTLAHKLKASKPMMSPQQQQQQSPGSGTTGGSSEAPSPAILLHQSSSGTALQESDSSSCLC